MNKAAECSDNLEGVTGGCASAEGIELQWFMGIARDLLKYVHTRNNKTVFKVL